MSGHMAGASGRRDRVGRDRIGTVGRGGRPMATIAGQHPPPQRRSLLRQGHAWSGRRIIALLAVALCLVYVALSVIAHVTARSHSAALGRPTHAVSALGNVPDEVAVVPAAADFPQGLTTGTCLRYRPLQGNRRLTVFVDPGHGGPDPGASGATSAGTTVYERNLTLATAQALVPLLRNDGYSVAVSRQSDTAVVRLQPEDTAQGAMTAQGDRLDAEARIACANASGATALLSINFNAYSDPSVGGAETLYDTARPFSAANARLAASVQHGIVSSLRAAGWPVPDRGVVDDSTVGTPALTGEGAAYGHLLELGPAASGWLDHPSAMPGVMCEPLFLTDPRGADIAVSARGQHAIAQGIRNALDAYLNATAPSIKRLSGR